MYDENLPIIRVVVAGCRDYNDYNDAKSYIDCCLSDIRDKSNIIIVSGGAKGADFLGEDRRCDAGNPNLL